MTATVTEPGDAPVNAPGAVRPVAPAPLFTRVTVVAPRTRIDVALPSDVAVADLLPMLLEMARVIEPDGGARHGGWCLARLGAEPLDPTGTLGGHGVVDGELLQLRKRSDAPPPPLFDDVIDAVALSSPEGYRPWTAETARRLGAGTAVLALLGAAAVLYRCGPGATEALVAAVSAVILVGVGAVIARVYGDSRTGVVLGAAALPLAFLAGLFAVPGGPGRPNMLLACVGTAVFATAALALLDAGVTILVAAAAAAVLGAGASSVAVLVAHPVPGIGAGLAAVALLGLSGAPRLTIQLARMPLPAVPTTAADLTADDAADFFDFGTIERHAALGHQYLSGLVLGFGVTAAVGALLAAQQGLWGIVLGGIVAAVLMLRARTYANGTQAGALLLAGIGTAGGLVVGWMLHGDRPTLLPWVFACCVLLAATALVLGVVFPQRRFSPVLRRTVELAEAVLIAAVLPVALAVAGLYTTMRNL